MSCEKPGELLESVIADVVRKELAGRHKSRDGDGDDDQIMAGENDKPTGPNTQDVRRRVDAFVDKVGLSKNGLSPGGSLGGKSKYKMKGNRKQQENKTGKTNTQIYPPSTQQSTYASQQEASGKRAKGKGGGKGNAYTKGKGKGKSITASKGAQTQDKIKQWTQTPKTQTQLKYFPKKQSSGGTPESRFQSGATSVHKRVGPPAETQNHTLAQKREEAKAMEKPTRSLIWIKTPPSIF